MFLVGRRQWRRTGWRRLRIQWQRWPPSTFCGRGAMPPTRTIPGAIDAWCTFNRESGTRPLAELLEPAARAAEDGYIVTPRVAADWHRSQAKLRDPVTAALFLPGGRPPAAGDRVKNPP